MMNERCPICYNMSLVVNQDENERSHGHCLDCGYNTDADAASEAESSVELERDTPFGEELDGGTIAEPFVEQGWPGDGSGMDDLADYNANEADDYRNE